MSGGICNDYILSSSSTSLRNIQKPQDIGMMDGSSTHHWSEEDHLAEKPRVREGHVSNKTYTCNFERG